MNKLVYLGPSVLQTTKIIMYEILYDYRKPKYGEKAKLYCMGYRQFYNLHKYRRHLYIYHKRLSNKITTSDYEFERPLPRGKYKNVIGLMKDELGEKIITEIALLRAMTYSYI